MSKYFEQEYKVTRNNRDASLGDQLSDRIYDIR